MARAQRDNRPPSATGALSRLAYARAREAGFDLRPVLRRAGITKRQIETPAAPVRVRDQIRFLNAVAELLDDDLLGFHLAQTCELRNMGLYYYVLASSETLGEALRRAARYTTIVNEGVSQTCIAADSFGMAYSHVGVSRHPDRHQVEFWMTALLRICRQLTGRNLHPERLCLAHHRADPGEMAMFFGTDIEFASSKDRILFSAGTGSLPVVSADPYLSRLLVSYCEEALERRAGSRGPFRASVENEVTSLLPHGKAHAGHVADRLGVSRRTFARRLSDEGTTFSDLLGELRADLANYYLGGDAFSISQIAWLLGYREVASFSKAYKRWTGLTPRERRVSPDADGDRDAS